MIFDDGSVVYKAVLMGEFGVGKKSILCRLSKDAFQETPAPMIGVDLIPVPINDKQSINLFNYQPSERFRAIPSSFLRGSHFAVFAFALSDRNSFDAVFDQWLQEAGKQLSAGCFLLLIGNKADLLGQRKVSSSEAESRAVKHDMMYLEASAKETPRQVFKNKFQELIDKRNMLVDLVRLPNPHVLPVPQPREEPPRNGGMCTLI